MSQRYRRHSDPITLLRFRHVDDDGRDEEETPDNTATDDEDDHPPTRGDPALWNPHPKWPCVGEERRAWSGSNPLDWIPNRGV